MTQEVSEAVVPFDPEQVLWKIIYAFNRGEIESILHEQESKDLTSTILSKLTNYEKLEFNKAFLAVYRKLAKLTANRILTEKMTPEQIQWLKDGAEVSLAYNHVIRALTTPPEIPKQYEAIPFRDSDTIELGTIYLEKSGHMVTMKKEVDATRGEFHHGFHFLGDNGVWYRPNGTTFSGPRGEMNDIFFVLRLKD